MKRSRVGTAVLVLLGLLAACQSTPPPPASGTTTTIGNTTITTSGRVSVAGGYAN